MFSEAGRRGRVTELDWICACAAYATALESPWYDLPLFVNVGPETFGSEGPADLRATHDEAMERLSPLLEITERVINNPGATLSAIGQAGRAIARIGLDDLGADPASLNILSLIRPDVIKLDGSIVQGTTRSWRIAYVINAALRQAERTSSVVLAKGIETPAHLEGCGAFAGGRRSRGSTLDRERVQRAIRMEAPSVHALRPKRLSSPGQLFECPQAPSIPRPAEGVAPPLLARGRASTSQRARAFGRSNQLRIHLPITTSAVAR